MKCLFALFACVFITRLLQAEVLIIPVGQGGKLTIAPGEVAIVSSYEKSYNVPQTVISEGVTNRVNLSMVQDKPAAFAGPMEIVFEAGASHFINYKRMQSNAIKSEIISHGRTNTMAVPEGKTVRFFSFVPDPAYEMQVNMFLAKGTNTWKVRYWSRNMEFSGPLAIMFTAPNSDPDPFEKAAVYSYYFTEDFLVMPDLGFLQGPTGAFEITVEKSADLTNWFPVMVQNTSNDQKAFYRLKLAR